MVGYRKRELRKKKEQPSKRAGVYSLRLDPDVMTRLERLLIYIGPRVQAMTGKHAGKADIIRAVMMRGIEMTEKEFGLHEPRMGFVLLDEE